jgi:uncharacterized protein YndB with AHSA1/START domain
MDKPSFVYVTYVRTTPEKLWRALIEPEFTRQYWAQTWHESDWTEGSPWRLMIPDGRVGDTGEVLEFSPYKRLVRSLRVEFKPELKAEGYCRLTYELDAMGDMVKLTLIQEFERPDSKVREAMSEGWPMLLASLKSLLETGTPLEATTRWPEGY